MVFQSEVEAVDFLDDDGFRCSSKKREFIGQPVCAGSRE